MSLEEGDGEGDEKDEGTKGVTSLMNLETCSKTSASVLAESLFPIRYS